MTDCCPTCGATLVRVKASWNPVARTFVTEERAVRFPSRQAKIFDALWVTRDRGGFETVESFMDAAYADCINGGPSCFNTLYVLLNRMRKKLNGSGYTVTLNMGQPRNGYRLIRESA